MPAYFEFKEDDISLTPIWGTLPSLPLECWHPNTLGKIGSRLGTPIAMDSLTMKMEQVSYARILVEVDASKNLIDEVEFVMPNGITRKQPVVYEFTPKFCTACNRFGHKRHAKHYHRRVRLISKYATFIAAPQHVTAERTAHLFLKHIVKYWGLSKDIVSNRDSRFTDAFWTKLFKILGSKLCMSSNYHPQSDGQTERFNFILEDYLWHFVRGTQKDWVKLLNIAQLCFNAQKSSSTNKSAFEIVTGQQPFLPHTLQTPQSVKSPFARSFSQEWK
ncbi:UNVERIFIED_CONTAM: hypothetical protein Sindi_2894100 [Sesamum indicum]